MRKIERPSMTLLLCSLLIVFPVACFAAPDGNTHETGTDAISLSSPSTPAERTAWSDAADVPAPQHGKSEVSRIGMGIRLSTLGAGAEVGVSLSNKLNVRDGFNIFQYNRGFNHDGVTYKGQLNLRSGEAHLDWYPIGHTFHLSPGLLVYNGNGATATANVPGGSTFTLGGTTYTSDPTNPITGTGKLDFVKAAPTAMFGFGNLVPQNRHLT